MYRTIISVAYLLSLITCICSLKLNNSTLQSINPKSVRIDTSKIDHLISIGLLDFRLGNDSKTNTLLNSDIVETVVYDKDNSNDQLTTMTNMNTTRLIDDKSNNSIDSLDLNRNESIDKISTNEPKNVSTISMTSTIENVLVNNSNQETFNHKIVFPELTYGIMIDHQARNESTNSIIGNTIFNNKTIDNLTSIDTSESPNSTVLTIHTDNPIALETYDTSNSSSVTRLLSNEDIKEYQNKRKEEDQIHIEHSKEIKVKNKYETSLPISLKKSKTAEDIVVINDINHLQETDIVNDAKVVRETTKPQLIVISFDGMRYDYMKMFRNNMDNFQRIAKLGVLAPFGLISSYVTQTIASHYSIATGLYEENSGIIGNIFFDPKFNESFKSYAMKGKFFAGEPIWVTAVRQNLESRIFFWPGSETPIGGLSATETIKFHSNNLTISIKEQIERVIEWTENGTDLSMAYNIQPDAAGHTFGIGSKEMNLAIKQLNRELGVLVNYVKQKNINLIVTADHGMVQLDKEKLVILENYLDFRKEIIRIPQFGPLAAIQPREGKIDQVMKKLAKIPFMKCYRKENIAEHYHYKHNYRIQPIICMAEISAYIIRTKDDLVPKFGMHGYDNRNIKMRPIFVAMGPDFKQNYITQPFEQIHLYSLFAHILDIQPANNNGSIHHIKHILSDTSLSRLMGNGI